MAYTDTDVATGALGLAIGGAIVQFNKVAVMPSLINMIACPPGSVTARVPVYTKLGVSNVETASAGAEGAENSETIATTAVDIEVLRNHIDVTITDLAAHGNTDALMVNAGEAIGNAVALEFDSQCLTGRVDDFATTVGANTTGMSMNKLFTAIAKLEENSAPRPYACVLHPLNMWGDFGITNEMGMVAANNESNGALAGGNAVGSALSSAGFVSNLGGVSIYTSPSVSIADGAGTAQGGVFAKTAISCAYIDFGNGNFVQIETQRASKAASTDMTANGYFAFAETVDLHGVTILNETV
tara:strand:+ start:245 stop:1141 length:897 start_codon:yes stop_codon:yes gene_type:complete